ncbi:TauD/TfdA family dioxygenase [Acidocella sp.]|uniref:TauD/TfdA family dioxygenase n=1 Tax=Acidocella sp. TaxID=50710 RepID=UPI00344BF17F
MRMDDYRTTLEAQGWCSLSTSVSITQAALSAAVASLAEELGEIVPGRGRRRVEQIVPQETQAAYAGSLSEQVGFAPMPLHTDTAHWTVPCRYMVMACAEPGPKPTPTMLLDSKTVALDARQSAACSTAVFLVRNGRQSFYGSITARDRPFIRFDLGCMEPLSAEGAEVADAISYQQNAEKARRHNWQRGDVLVIDNWRTLHGRGVDDHTAPGRVLLRAMVR